MKLFHLPGNINKILIVTLCGIWGCIGFTAAQSRSIEDFDASWKFHLGDIPDAQQVNFNDASWRILNLPHDWSIEGNFDEKSPATTGGGALTGGIGWYRKTFTLAASSTGKNIFIDFDGVYLNSEVWINGHYLGKRPYGFSSFRYDLTPFLKFGQDSNCLAVKVDNSQQPNSRWYSGSGIYRNVWLVTTDKVFIDHWGTFLTTPVVSEESATVQLSIQIAHSERDKKEISVKTFIYDADGKEITQSVTNLSIKEKAGCMQKLVVRKPMLWSDQHPYLYKAVTQVWGKGKLLDNYTTPFGIRFFSFDVHKGFLLNGKPVKINGVCDHHDLGCLGAAINTRALERQIEILKGMGCNAIRTSHNPPAPELLDLCDKMGMIVMDEAFDMWKKEKNPYDYHLVWEEWHQKDLEDLILRDRNHPSVIIWSIGNEIPEQGDSSGTRIARELAGIVRQLDTTRPITSAMDQPYTSNYIYKSGALDLVGYNYHQRDYADFPQRFPGQKFIGTETVSALETRGQYDIQIPSDSIRRWPTAWDKPFNEGNPQMTVSAYDNVSAPWGSTHEETWKEIKKHDFLSGQFIWTGFDYIGEPTPYPWPARSSYFGIIDLAGFPKDVYYMYKSEWTDRPVLHLLPHWNWKPGQMVDVWAYYNRADQVELFLNGRSLGKRKKQGEDLHVMWRVNYEPGILKAVSYMNGKQVMTTEVKTAGPAAKIVLTPDRGHIMADGKDLCFVTAKVVDADGNLVPDAGQEIHFSISGEGFIAGVDNGFEANLEPFKSNQHKAFNGLCLAVIQSAGKPGSIKLEASAEGLKSGGLFIKAGGASKN